MDAKLKEAIQRLTEYNYAQEMAHYEGCEPEEQKNHIFKTIEFINAEIESEPEELKIFDGSCPFCNCSSMEEQDQYVLDYETVFIMKCEECKKEITTNAMYTYEPVEECD